jgi:hypothetical protein
MIIIHCSFLTDENASTYQIISSGKIIDILQLKHGFYAELQQCLQEEELEDEPSWPEEILLQLMSNRFESCSKESMQVNEILEKVGFVSQFAEDFANHIKADPLDMTLWDWIHHFVVSTLDHLAMKRIDWPTDRSYVTIERSYEGLMTDKNKDFTKKDFLNGDFPKNILKILAAEVGKTALDQMEFWFHGTSPECADDIVSEGIRLGVGKLNANFSHKDGFYLTDDLDLALRSAFQKYCIPKLLIDRKTLEEICVIVFAFPKAENYLLAINEHNEEIGIDLRPTPEELASNKLQNSKEERLRRIVYFFSNLDKTR